MRCVRWLRGAERSLESIADYIAQDNIRAADELIDRVREAGQHLAEYPFMGRPGKVNNTRELVVLANYIVVYRAKEARIDILRVMHVARRWPDSF